RVKYTRKETKVKPAIEKTKAKTKREQLAELYEAADKALEAADKAQNEMIEGALANVDPRTIPQCVPIHVEPFDQGICFAVMDENAKVLAVVPLGCGVAQSFIELLAEALEEHRAEIRAEHDAED